MIFDAHSLTVGATGAGKTITAKVQVERLLGAGRHVCIIDPTSVWHGLRAAADGVGPGYAIPIFGGPQGDVQITAGQGSKIGDIIAGGVSAIIDLSLMDSDEQQEFVASLIAVLRRKPRGNFHLIVDEADEFAPQTSPSKAGEACKRQMEWVAKRGRVQGFVLAAITQRPADIAKSVISQMQTLIAHQLTAPSDQDAVKAYLRANADKATLDKVMSSLASLDRGERWIYSPREGILECGISPLPSTFDTSRTPEPGELVSEPKMLAQIDLGAIREALKPAEEETGESADNDDSAEIAQLREQVRSLEAERDELVVDHGYGQQQLNALVAERDELRRLIDEFRIDVERVSIALRDQDDRAALCMKVEGTDTVQQLPSKPPLHAMREVGADVDILDNGGSVPVMRPQQKNHPEYPPRHQKILDALAWATAMLSKDHVERNIVAWFAGISPKSSSYANDLGAMRTAGLIEYPAGGMLMLTQQGGEWARWPSLNPTRDDLLDAIKNRLEPRFCRILDAVYGASTPMNREELAEEIGVSAASSSFANDLGKLRTLGLIEYPRPGIVGLGRVLS